MAIEAGLTAPIIYGEVEKKSYIIEVVGCGVAFIDYDNDGWMDLFVTSYFMSVVETARTYLGLPHHAATL